MLFLPRGDRLQYDRRVVAALDLGQGVERQDEVAVAGERAGEDVLDGEPRGPVLRARSRPPSARSTSAAAGPRGGRPRAERR
jgi:hypothetical protein